MLRAAAGLDYDAVAGHFPTLLIVTHQLRQVLSTGLPDPDYNDGLMELDLHLVSLVDEGQGRTVLVETFNGRRNYYAYLSDDVDIEALERDTQSRFPGETLSWEPRNDPDWQFIKGYARDFDF